MPKQIGRTGTDLAGFHIIRRGLPVILLAMLRDGTLHQPKSASNA
jgi:hypothetical protein